MSNLPEEGTTTLPEQIENVVVLARAVAEETPSREISLVVTNLEQAQMWAERAEDGGP